VNEELKMVWKKATVVYFKLLLQVSGTNSRNF